jgi:hypothetical protein
MSQESRSGSLILSLINDGVQRVFPRAQDMLLLLKSAAEGPVKNLSRVTGQRKKLNVCAKRTDAPTPSLHYSSAHCENNQWATSRIVCRYDTPVLVGNPQVGMGPSLNSG